MVEVSSLTLIVSPALSPVSPPICGCAVLLSVLLLLVRVRDASPLRISII